MSSDTETSSGTETSARVCFSSGILAAIFQSRNRASWWASSATLQQFTSVPQWQRQGVNRSSVAALSLGLAALQGLPSTHSTRLAEPGRRPLPPPCPSCLLNSRPPGWHSRALCPSRQLSGSRTRREEWPQPREGRRRQRAQRPGAKRVSAPRLPELRLGSCLILFLLISFVLTSALRRGSASTACQRRSAAASATWLSSTGRP